MYVSWTSAVLLQIVVDTSVYLLLRFSLAGAPRPCEVCRSVLSAALLLCYSTLARDIIVGCSPSSGVRTYIEFT